MTLQTIDQILKRAGKLTPSERLLLANRLIQGVRQDMPPGRKLHRKWSDVAGILPYPAFGMDAQLYISRSRSEDGNHRAHVIRDGK